MRESDVRRHLIEKLHGFGHIEAIENTAGVGNPDVNYCFNSFEGWIEIKFRKELPKRAGTPVFGKCLRPAQHIWFRKRFAACHQRLFIYGRADDKLWLIPGRLHYEFEEMTLKELNENALWSGELRSANWVRLYKQLVASHIDVPRYLV